MFDSPLTRMTNGMMMTTWVITRGHGGEESSLIASSAGDSKDLRFSG